MINRVNECQRENQTRPPPPKAPTPTTLAKAGGTGETSDSSNAGTNSNSTNTENGNNTNSTMIFATDFKAPPADFPGAPDGPQNMEHSGITYLPWKYATAGCFRSSHDGEKGAYCCELCQEHTPSSGDWKNGRIMTQRHSVLCDHENQVPTTPLYYENKTVCHMFANPKNAGKQQPTGRIYPKHSLGGSSASDPGSTPAEVSPPIVTPEDSRLQDPNETRYDDETLLDVITSILIGLISLGDTEINSPEFEQMGH